jgi:hypothetical protein
MTKERSAVLPRTFLFGAEAATPTLRREAELSLEEIEAIIAGVSSGIGDGVARELDRD